MKCETRGCPVGRGEQQPASGGPVAEPPLLAVIGDTLNFQKVTPPWFAHLYTKFLFDTWKSQNLLLRGSQRQRGLIKHFNTTACLACLDSWLQGWPAGEVGLRVKESL